MQKKYNAILFDLDGTLLNTLDDLAASVNFALSAHGFPPRTLNEIRSFVGNGVANLIERSLPEGTEEAVCSAVLTTFKSHYSEHSMDQTKPYHGIMKLLDTLLSMGYPMAIVSNKFQGAVSELNQRFFQNHIPVAIGESQGIQKKPAPDSLLKALQLLGESPKRAVYIGDSEVDLQTAKNAGLPCISVTWGFRDKPLLVSHGATLFANTPEELLALLSC